VAASDRGFERYLTVEIATTTPLARRALYLPSGHARCWPTPCRSGWRCWPRVFHRRFSSSPACAILIGGRSPLSADGAQLQTICQCPWCLFLGLFSVFCWANCNLHSIIVSARLARMGPVAHLWQVAASWPPIAIGADPLIDGPPTHLGPSPRSIVCSRSIILAPSLWRLGTSPGFALGSCCRPSVGSSPRIAIPLVAVGVGVRLPARCRCRPLQAVRHRHLGSLALAGADAARSSWLELVTP